MNTVERLNEIIKELRENRRDHHRIAEEVLQSNNFVPSFYTATIGGNDRVWVHRHSDLAVLVNRKGWIRQFRGFIVDPHTNERYRVPPHEIRAETLALEKMELV